jgi:hypothetical protein
MVSVAAVFVGLGFVLHSIATIIMLNYSSSQYPIESAENIYWFSGIIVFIIASILLIAVGIFIVFGGLKYFVGTFSQKLMFVGIMLSSFYLLCLGVCFGSARSEFANLVVGCNCNSCRGECHNLYGSFLSSQVCSVFARNR